MVFYFTSSQGYVIYMGRDKFENEDLIRYGWPEDIWFHVDNLSSAHVYLRQKKGETIDDLSPGLLNECCQLVKANSIEGCKLKSCDVVFTKWSNLKKTQGMEIGQVGFHQENEVQKTTVTKVNSIVNSLNRTRVEEYPDLAELQQKRDEEHRAGQKAMRREQQRLNKLAQQKKEEEKKIRSYSGLMDKQDSKITSQYTPTSDSTASVAYEEDFF